MTAFYNEIDPYAAEWLRNLIAAGHIAPGIVDERPIQEIEPWDLHGFTQCHFFAGIGIWSLALRRAGWSDDRPIWTGSCPCQPFSNAGKKKGISDDRHLWPYWYSLIKQCKPPIVIGEQVASKDGLGWLDLVSADMERTGYAIGASDLCAAGFGGAHIRQRLYFVGLADSEGERLPGRADDFNGGRRKFASGQGSEISGLADDEQGPQGRAGMPECENQCSVRSSSLVERMGKPAGATGEWDAGEIPATQTGFDSARVAVDGDFGVGFADASGVEWLADASRENQSGRRIQGYRESDSKSLRTIGERSLGLGANNGISRSVRDPGEIDERWMSLDWLLCRNPAGDPSWRPVEPGTFPLAHGVTQRVGKLRAYGNGLDAETASKFCEIVKEISDGV